VVRVENLKKCGTVYHIHCDQCNKQYTGETSRVLETRIKEHLSRDSSAVHEHCQLTGHSVDSSKTKVLATESNTFKRRIREAIEIRLRKSSLNRDNGFELANIYNTILGPLRPLWSDITLRNIHISTVADEVRLVRMKYPTLTVFKKFLLRSESGNILLFLKSCFQSRKTIFLIVLCHLSDFTIKEPPVIGRKVCTQRARFAQCFF